MSEPREPAVVEGVSEPVIARAAVNPAELRDVAVEAVDEPRPLPVVSVSLPQIVEDNPQAEAFIDPAETSVVETAALETTPTAQAKRVTVTRSVVAPASAFEEADIVVETMSLADTPAEAPAAESETSRFAVITASAVNLRAGPSTSFGRVGRVLRGDIVELTQSIDGVWVEIVKPDTGQRVWMHGRYLDELPG